jgi:hypothetical protein
MQKGYLIREQNCSIFYMKTMLTSVAFRKHTCKMTNLLISEDTKFSGVIEKKERKKERKKAVNACCCGLLECANYGPAPPTSALRVSVMVTSPLASGIRHFLEAQEGLYRSQTGFILGVFSRSLSHKWVCRKATEV